MARAAHLARPRLSTASTLLLLLVVVAIAPAPTASASTALGPSADAPGDPDEDPTLFWPQLLPPAPVGEATDADRRCGSDGTVCLRRVERELGRLAEELGCDHRAVFATTYQLLTRELRRTVEHDPDAFDDPAGIGLLAEVFHTMYEQALAAHEHGEPLPEAWHVAFDAAAHADHSAGQDMLLAINAHVQRDMPFAIEAVGLRAPDGTSRRADHNRVNQVLRRAYEEIVPEVADRYDPNLHHAGGQPAGADGTAATQLVAGWREGVWRNAERLGAATSPAHREAVATSIEENARLWAEGIAAPQAPGYRDVRAEHCEQALDRSDQRD
jgi:hypothetical protein